MMPQLTLKTPAMNDDKHVKIGPGSSFMWLYYSAVHAIFCVRQPFPLSGRSTTELKMHEIIPHPTVWNEERSC